MKRNRFFSVVAVILIGLCTAVFWLPHSRKPAVQGNDPLKTISKSEWETLLKGGNQFGPKEAPVVLVEFSDFQCPYCRMFEQVLDKYRDAHPDRIRVIMYNYPLNQHPQSHIAAKAAECVAKTGNYERFHRLLFANQDRFASQPWDSLARLSGITDTAAFHGCLRDSAIARSIKHQIKLGDEVGLYQTPTIIINRDFYSGTLSYPKLVQAVDRAMKSQ